MNHKTNRKTDHKTNNKTNKEIKDFLKTQAVFFSVKPPSWNMILRRLNTSLLPFVVCDQKLGKHPTVKAWLKTRRVYFIPGGESVKDAEQFPRHVKNILRLAGDKKIADFIALGGGSVGDFTGFTAGVYKRGVASVSHIPTTWLSALDSAHGGKTALNLSGVKNALGVYCFPKAVFIVKEFLSFLPKEQQEHAKGELFKIALIDGGALYKEVIKNPVCPDFWSLLPRAIWAKRKIVQKDPYGKKGLRDQLNLGHTVGHVLESYFRLPHGRAVMYGLSFALKWGARFFMLPAGFLKEVGFLNLRPPLKFYLNKIPDKVFHRLLLQDKKRMEGQHIRFVFVKKPGRVVCKEVSVREILQEARRQRR